jgi:hypothetical protein
VTHSGVEIDRIKLLYIRSISGPGDQREFSRAICFRDLRAIVRGFAFLKYIVVYWTFDREKVVRVCVHQDLLKPWKPPRCRQYRHALALAYG